MSFMEQLKDGLSKTRKNFTERMEDLVGAAWTWTRTSWMRWR